MNLLPDDVEHYLISGQRRRAAYALMQQGWISYPEALAEIDRRLAELRQSLRSTDPGVPPPHDPGHHLPALEAGAISFPLPPI